MPNKTHLIQQLRELAELMRVLGENEFKVRAYDKASDTLESTEVDLQDIASGKTKIAGIGEGIRALIVSFINDKTINGLEEARKKVPEGVFALMQIPGLGAKKALVIVEELGIKSVGELEYACRENRLMTIKGFGEKAQTKILKSIEDQKQYAGKVRIDVAFELFQDWKTKLKKDFSKGGFFELGDIARHTEIVEELKFLVVGDLDTKKLKKKIEEISGSSVMEFKEKDVLKFSISEDQKLPITIFYSEKHPKEEWMKKETAHPELKEKIAEFSEWQNAWLEPELVKRKPTSLKKYATTKNKLRGFFHCHTTLSDGQDSLEAMVKEAENQGFEYIGISDHSQSAFYAQGLKPEVLERQHEEIKTLQKKTKVKIFHGVESDILSDGELDYTSKQLSMLDFVIGSIHSRFQMDAQAMTKRLTHALENPWTTFWGHPTGRLLLARSGYAFDLNSCFKAMAKNDVVIELNCNPHRLDMDWRWGEEIEKHGLKVCVNPDAHSTDGILDMRFGEWMLEKAMIPSTQVLNLMSSDEVEEFLSKRKSKAKK